MNLAHTAYTSNIHTTVASLLLSSGGSLHTQMTILFLFHVRARNSSESQKRTAIAGKKQSNFTFNIAIINNINNGQNNLAMGGIAANWGLEPQISPTHGGLRTLSNTVLLGTTRVFLSNGTLFHQRH